MNQNDKQHIEAICLRHGIQWMSRGEAIVRMMASGEQGLKLLASGGSFSTRKVNPHTGEVEFQGFYLDQIDSQPNTTGTHWEQGDFDQDEHEYFVALHELGHIILKHKEGTVAEDVQNEVNAWEWAFAHAQYFPSDETLVEILTAITTYTHLESAMDQGIIPDIRQPWEKMQEAA